MSAKCLWLTFTSLFILVRALRLQGPSIVVAVNLLLIIWVISTYYSKQRLCSKGPCYGVTQWYPNCCVSSSFEECFSFDSSSDPLHSCCEVLTGPNPQVWNHWCNRFKHRLNLKIIIKSKTNTHFCPWNLVGNCWRDKRDVNVHMLHWSLWIHKTFWCNTDIPQFDLFNPFDEGFPPLFRLLA